MALPRMRTAKGVLAEIQAQDPDTEITLHYIRYLIKTNEVPVVPVGVKKLVDVDAVLEYLSSGALVPTKDDMTSGRIRMVKP